MYQLIYFERDCSANRKKLDQIDVGIQKHTDISNNKRKAKTAF